MPRGFLKDIGGIKRLRMVKAGRDANDLGLPYNDVVFDSTFPVSLTPRAIGIVRVTEHGNPVKIVSWIDQGYIPLTFARAKAVDSNLWYSSVPWTSNNPYLSVGRDGLYLITGSFNLPVDIAYIAFRVAG